MTKAEIALRISKETGLEKTQVLPVIEGFMDAVKESLGRGENVYLRGFGSFIVRRRAQKIARNITRNTAMIVPAHNIPAFRPAPAFGKMIR